VLKIAVLDDYHHVALEVADWASLDAEVAFFDRPIARDQLGTTLEEFDVVVLMRERTAFPREVIEQLPNLKLVVTTGVRNASVDGDYLKERGITYCGTGTGARPPERGANTGVSGPVEIAWGLILALVKRITIEDREMRHGRWQTAMPSNLPGSTLGLLGLGRLGAQMVAPAHAFGMNVIAWSQNMTAEHAEQAGAELVSKDELIERSDVLSIHVVLSERTRGLIAAADFARMKPTAYLINTSRGPIVDEQAMIEALETNQIAGAGLDVYDVEPLPEDSPLLRLPNTVLVPHLGYVSRDAFTLMYRQAVEDIAAFQAGEPIRLVR
jgi:phosphoglycerate dehydrogenase-like enzyme